jgi:hypothetical protein
MYNIHISKTVQVLYQSDACICTLSEPRRTCNTGLGYEDDTGMSHSAEAQETVSLKTLATRLNKLPCLDLLFHWPVCDNGFCTASTSLRLLHAWIPQVDSSITASNNYYTRELAILFLARILTTPHAAVKASRLLCLCPHRRWSSLTWRTLT